MTDPKRPIKFKVRPEPAEEPPAYDNRASIQPVSDVVAGLPMEPSPKPEVCSVQRTVGAVVVPRPVMRVNPQNQRVEQVNELTIQFIANETHEFRYSETWGWYCIFCRKPPLTALDE